MDSVEEGAKKKKKGGALVAFLSILLTKGGFIAAKTLPTFGDDALRVGAHLAPLGDDALRGASLATHEAGNLAGFADDAGKAAVNLEHSSGLVDDGSKIVKRAPSLRMSDSERIVRSAQNYARHKARQYGRDRKEEREDQNR